MIQGKINIYKIAFFILFVVLLSGCQMGYLIKNAYHQMKILYDREPIENVLKKENVSTQTKQKLLLAEKAKLFAETKLNLKSSKNYTSFVQLDRPYVVYAVNAAPAWELKNHTWYFPIVGHVPYKGFYSESEAKEEEELLKKQNLDTYVRGVSAYSTLGWFNDPLLSSMLNYKDHNLVNTIIHETVHATLYIKSNADFNERLASFVGNKGTELFYLEQEGEGSLTLQKIKDENQDDKLFSEYISPKIKEIKSWYESLDDKQRKLELKEEKLKALQKDFELTLLPKMKTNSYKGFASMKLNNARLLLFSTYVANMEVFERVYSHFNSDFSKFINYCKSLEASENPEKDFGKILNELL